METSEATLGAGEGLGKWIPGRIVVDHRGNLHSLVRVLGGPAVLSPALIDQFVWSRSAR
ncbi:hypothetical protein CUJ84_pRLN1000329 (plasmid) [Rhizobium leguminosarum]|uniref:Uncharacterized protein n=1 Tax=Rhizobium leguminosarum TaxID=384 RepID=A0A2K9ZC18_RHILE|nr:hypothetical protein CUJ84_pRLN1000329 [Rhizobium leguminosarum]